MEQFSRADSGVLDLIVAFEAPHAYVGLTFAITLELELQASVYFPYEPPSHSGRALCFTLEISLEFELKASGAFYSGPSSSFGSSSLHSTDICKEGKESIPCGSSSASLRALPSSTTSSEVGEGWGTLVPLLSDTSAYLTASEKGRKAQGT